MEPVAHNLSLLTLVGQADPVVKGVMLALLIASLWSWSIAIDKLFTFGDVKSRARDFERKFWSTQEPDEVDDRGSEKPGGAVARVFAAGSREWRLAERAAATVDAIKMAQERCDRLMQAAIQREVAKLGKGLNVLATIGSATPFIGLFGTVWGIMNSFTAIAANQQTNLAVVAPGIAEALMATAMGLGAAIPAVVFYNKFSAELDEIGDSFESVADEASVRFSRRLAERA
jgi:biopolymer transport protein TolQ